MDNEDITMNFQSALNHSIGKIGYGAQRKIAEKAGISQQYISGILSGKRFGKEDVRRDIAKACGYDYEDFLKLGKNLLACQPRPGMKRIGGPVGIGWSDVPDTQGEGSGINQNSNIDAKVGSGMDSNEKDAILRHCLEELAALREEIRYLREERNELRDRLKQEKEKHGPASEPEEKKTAV